MPNLLDTVGDALDVDVHKDKGRTVLWAFIGLAAVTGLLIAVLSPWKAFALILGAVFAYFGYFRPKIVIAALAVYTPFEPFLLKFVADDIYVFARYFSEVLIYLLIAIVLIRMIVKRRKYVPTPIDLPFVFFVVTALASLVLNAVPLFNGLLGLRQIVRFILLFFVTVQLDPDEIFIKRLTLVMFAIMVFQGLLGFMQSIVGAPLDEFLIPSERRFYESIQLTTGTEQFWSPGTRVFATLGRYDQLGTFLSFFFAIALGLWYQLKDERYRRMLLAAMVVALPAFLLTLSRASWFGFALALFVVGAVLMKDKRVRLGYLACVIVAVSYLAYSGLAVRYLVDSADQTFVERFFEAFSYERWRGEYLGLGRLFWVVQTVTTVVPAAPLFGWGPGQYGGGAAAALGNVNVYQELNLPFGVYGSEGYIDNNWFSLWGETGTIGIAFYLWMYFALMLLAYRTWKRSENPHTRGLALGLFGALLAVGFQAFLATYLEVRTLALYVWLYAAFVYVLARKERITGPSS